MPASELLCIIPARGNSKRFPRKNLALLQGVPLIAYAINAAKDSTLFSSICVSSEDAEILRVAEEYGATPLPRPPHLSGDDVSIAAVCLDILTSFVKAGKRYEAFAMMQPTSPLRNADDVRACCNIFRSVDCDACLSVVPCSHPPQRALSMATGYLRPFLPPEHVEKGTQQLESLYLCNGAVSFVRTDAFLREKTFFVQKAAAYVMPAERGIDIDEPIHMRWAEFLLTQASAS